MCCIMYFKRVIVLSFFIFFFIKYDFDVEIELFLILFDKILFLVCFICGCVVDM